MDSFIHNVQLAYKIGKSLYWLSSQIVPTPVIYAYYVYHAYCTTNAVIDNARYMKYVAIATKNMITGRTRQEEYKKLNQKKVLVVEEDEDYVVIT